jgi:hypothetical protein
MENPEQIELLESELDFLINKARKSGLSYWWILRVILSRIENLVMQADVEYYVKGGK